MSSTVSDEEWMRCYVQEADPAAFESLFRRYAGRLQSYFRRFVSSDAVAQDMVQQTFLHVHRARRDFKLGKKFRPWLYAIAANVRREHFRRRSRKPELQFDPERHPEPSVQPKVSTPEQRAVRRALLQLSDSQREVVVLHWYEGMTFSEVGQVVGASTSAVKVRAHRAYKKLKQVLEEGV